jgi:intracellular sulfur oxidation DsrE/DsrF family protein
MIMDDKYSDERLHMFVDNEMNSSDRAEVMEAISKDDNLSNRVCELVQLKDAVRLAYSEPPKSSYENSQWSPSHNTGAYMSIAASILLLAVGALAGWMSYPQLSGQYGDVVASAAQHQSDKIIVHISQADPAQFSNTLAYTEKFLEEHKDSGDQIDVVAHASGLTLMRADVSPLKQQIVALMDKYDNVHFIACAGAIKMYRQKNGVARDIIIGVGTDTTAFDHIVGRLQSGGWKYIKAETLSEI